MNQGPGNMELPKAGVFDLFPPEDICSQTGATDDRSDYEREPGLDESKSNAEPTEKVEGNTRPEVLRTPIPREEVHIWFVQPSGPKFIDQFRVNRFRRHVRVQSGLDVPHRNKPEQTCGDQSATAQERRFPV